MRSRVHTHTYTCKRYTYTSHTQHTYAQTHVENSLARVGPGPRGRVGSQVKAEDRLLSPGFWVALGKVRLSEEKGMWEAAAARQ